MKTGTKAADSAAFANRLLTRLGIWKAIVNADAGPPVPKKLAATISRDRPATREKPVAIEKIAVLRATPPPPGGAAAGDSSAPASAESVKAAIVRRSAARPGFAGMPAALHMANIHSQKKRILRSERERLENRLYTSTIKTYFRRLESSAESSEHADLEKVHRELVSTIDKAVKRGAMHRNTGARKKSRAARVLAAAGKTGASDS